MGPVWKQSEAVEQLFSRQRATDPLGLKFHMVGAVTACVLAGWPTTFVTWAALPLIVFCAVRMTTNHPILAPLWKSWTARWAIMWAAWVMMGVVWSPDRGAGWDEVGVLPFLLMILAIYPVLDRRRLLLGAVLVGMACGMATQVLHGLGERFGWAGLMWNRLPGRNSGWWDPVIGGSLLSAMVGMCFSMCLWGRGWTRGVGATLGLAALAGLAATGTRGAWIGGAITIGLALMMKGIGAIRMGARARASGERNWMGAAVVAVIVMVVATGAALVASGGGGPFGEQIRGRVDAGVREVRAARGAGDYTSDTGRRLAMWEWAYAAWRCHPVLGVGTGGYRAWVSAQAALVRTGDLRACGYHGPVDGMGAEVHGHAHGTLPHTLATNGAVGLVILAGLIGAAMVSCIRGARSAGWPGDVHGVEGTASDGLLSLVVLFGLVGLFAAGLFDTVTVNQQTWYLASLLLAFSVEVRPREWEGRPGTEADGARDGFGGEG